MDQALQGQRAVVITVSDRCAAGERKDLSGPAAARVLREAGASLDASVIVSDEQPEIAAALRNAAAFGAVIIVTTGGTGLATRDVTPEATASVCDRLIPGLAEQMRLDGLRHTPFSVLSRGICGTLGTALILNLPGSPEGAESSLRSVLALLPHALALLSGATGHDEVAPNPAAAKDTRSA